MIMIIMIIIMILIMNIVIIIVVVKHLSPITDNSRLIEVYWWFGASPYRLTRLCLPSNTIVKLCICTIVRAMQYHYAIQIE